MGNIITEKLFNLSTYSLAGAGVVINWGDIKGIILFAGAVVLLSLQIALHIIKIIKERKEK